MKKNKSHALRQKRYRARKKWAADFDAERLEKLLIDPHEQKPFQDCQTPEQTLHAARVFAFAFRQKGVDCPDISADETIERFAYRVTRLWYSAPLGKILHFVSLKTFEFDADQGFTNALPLETFDSDWQPIPGSDITVDVASLAPIAPARAARAASPKKPECDGNSELCTDQTCLYFSWEIEFARRRESERKQIEKSNELEWLAFQRQLLEEKQSLPSVSFRISDDF